ncbi:MAG: SRPBCC family protein [Thermoleophilaceae bacterium]
MSGHTLRIERQIPRADPGGLRRLDERGGDPPLLARRARLETTEVEVDLRVGGAIRVVMRNPHEDIEYGGGGRYTEIEPPTRLRTLEAARPGG